MMFVHNNVFVHRDACVYQTPNGETQSADNDYYFFFFFYSVWWRIADGHAEKIKLIHYTAALRGTV